MGKDFSGKITNKKQAETYFKKSLPDSFRFAIAGTANEVAFEGIKKSNKIFQKEFTLSNKFLTGTAPGKGVLKFNKAIPHHNLNKIESSWGAPAKKGQSDLSFLVKQEDGFTSDKMVPTKNAYPSKNKDRVIKYNLRRRNIQLKTTAGFPRGIAKTNQQRTLFFMKKMFQNKYALPGSKQFIYLRPQDEFFNFQEGMYQFAGNTPLHPNSFPKLRLIYSTTDKKNKKRDATHWMEQSKDSFTQSEIDKIWEKEFNRSFTIAMKKLKL